MSTDFRAGRAVLDSSTMTDELSMEHLSFAIEHLTWMRNEGWMLLQSEELLTPEQWESLRMGARIIKRDFGDGPAVLYLFRKIVDRGIKDLIRHAKRLHEGCDYEVFIEKWQKEKEKDKGFRAWIANLMFELDNGNLNMGVGADANWSRGALERLDALVPLAQMLRSEHFLRELGQDRMRTHDDAMLEAYVQHNKNW